jgi:glutamine synthetase
MMPKPFADQPGSGMHFHVSLWSGPVHDRHGNARNLCVPHRADGAVDAAALAAAKTLSQSDSTVDQA